MDIQDGVHAAEVALRFWQRVDADPDAPAVIAAEPGQSPRILSYGYLDHWTRRIAADLNNPATSPRPLVHERPIAVIMEHGADLVAGLLAVVLTGRFYTALDPALPDDRLASLIVSADPSLILVHGATAARVRVVAGQGIPVLDLAPEDEDLDPNSPRPIMQDDATLMGRFRAAGQPAFLLFLPDDEHGARPRASLHTQASLLRNVDLYVQDLGVSSRDRVGFVVSADEPLSVICLFGALLSGAALCPFDVSRRPLAAFASWAEDVGLTILGLTPGFYRRMATAFLGDGPLPKLRWIHLGGAPVRRSDMEFFRRMFLSQARLHLGLLTTECGLVARYIPTDDQLQDAGPVPLGRPYYDVETVLVEPDGYPVTPGAGGELAIRAAHVTTVYWREGRPDPKRVVPDPSDPMKLFIRTGHLVIERVAGDLVPLESGEDARHLHDDPAGAQFPDYIDDDAPLASFDADDAPQGEPAPWPRDDESLEPEGAFGDAEFSQYGDELEHGQVPDDLDDPEGPDDPYHPDDPGQPENPGDLDDWTPSQPLARSDRDLFDEGDTLDDIDFPETEFPSQDEPVHAKPGHDREEFDYRPELAPRLSLEERVSRSFEAVLRHQPVQPTDNFFLLGGDHREAIALAAMLERQLDKPVSPSLLLEVSTPRDLAARLGAGQGGRPARFAPGMPGAIPLFCIAGPGTYTLEFERLLDHVDERVPVYGLDLPGFGGLGSVPSSMMGLVHRAAGQIASVTPDSPVALLGHGAGGAIAFEVARALEAAGQRVVWLGMIDTLSPSWLARSWGTRALALLGWFRYALRAGPAKAWAVSRAQSVRRRAKHLPPLSARTHRRGTSPMATYQKLLARYKPRRAALEPVLFRHTFPPFALVNGHDDWDQLTDEGVHTVGVRGDALSVLEKPGVETIAEAINEALTSQVALLAAFWSLDGAPNLDLEILDADRLPIGERALLDHRRTMAEELEDKISVAAGLRVLALRAVDNTIVVKLIALDPRAAPGDRPGSGFPLIAAVVRILDAQGSQEDLEQLRGGEVPFTELLTGGTRAGSALSCRPVAYFRVRAGDDLAALLSLSTASERLYGRHSQVHDEDGRLLVEALEILPPQERH